MGGEWIIGTFEAKTVAYVCFLGALLAVSWKRIPLALALIGLTISFHPAVGMWGAWGTGLALLALPRDPPPRRCAGAGSRSSSPSRASSARSPRSGARRPRSNASSCSRRFPYHTDPFFGGNTLACRSGRAARRDARRRCSRSTSGPPGVRLATCSNASSSRSRSRPRCRSRSRSSPATFHVWDYLRLMPLRSFPLIVPLVFFFQAIRVALAALHSRGRQPAPAPAGAAPAPTSGSSPSSLIALFPTAPLLAAPRLVRRNVLSWTKEDDIADAFGWVRRNLPRRPPASSRWTARTRSSEPRCRRSSTGRPSPTTGWANGSGASTSSSVVRTTSTATGWHGNLPDLRAAYDSLTLEQIHRDRGGVRRDLPRHRDRLPAPAPAHRGPGPRSTRSSPGRWPSRAPAINRGAARRAP